MTSDDHVHRQSPQSAVSRRGQVAENPITGERAVILTDPLVHPDGILVAHLYVRPGGRVATEHIHPTLAERFHVLHGQIAVSVDGRERVLGPGDHAAVPVGARHDWWQTGDEEAQALVEVTPGVRFLEMVGTMGSGARRQDRRSAAARTPADGGHGAGVPRRAGGDQPTPVVQTIMFSALGPIGRMLGRRATYPEYERLDRSVEPDTAALALLTRDGRLRAEP